MFCFQLERSTKFCIEYYISKYFSLCSSDLLKAFSVLESCINLLNFSLKNISQIVKD